MMKDYWLLSSICCPLATLAIIPLYDLHTCIFVAIVMFGTALLLGKYFEEREIEQLEALEKEEKDAGQPTEPT